MEEHSGECVVEREVGGRVVSVVVVASVIAVPVLIISAVVVVVGAVVVVVVVTLGGKMESKVGKLPEPASAKFCGK